MKRLAHSRLFWGICLVLTLAFIWSNSLRGKAASSEQSGHVAAFLRLFLDPKHRISDETFSFLVRKGAHFSEFALLGFEIRGLRCAIPSLRYPLIVLFPAVCATVDEVIQIFSGRGPSCADVLLDACGGCAGIGFFCLLIFLIRWARGRSRSC